MRVALRYDLLRFSLCSADLLGECLRTSQTLPPPSSPPPSTGVCPKWALIWSPPCYCTKNPKMGAACNVVQNELMLCCSVALSGPKMGFLSVMGRSGLPKGNLWIAFSVKCTAPPPGDWWDSGPLWSSLSLPSWKRSWVGFFAQLSFLRYTGCMSKELSDRASIQEDAWESLSWPSPALAGGGLFHFVTSSSSVSCGVLPLNGRSGHRYQTVCRAVLGSLVWTPLCARYQVQLLDDQSTSLLPAWEQGVFALGLSAGDSLLLASLQVVGCFLPRS